MAEFETLFSRYDRLFFFDTETTGLHANRDEIIEFAAVLVEKVDGAPQIVREYDELITLTPGKTVSPEIQNLTGITNEDIAARGIPKDRACREVSEMLAGNTLLLAYNANFDLCFLYYMLQRDGDPSILRGKDKIDLLTVYKDRRSYPHKLCNAIESYNLQDRFVNSHRAVDDVIATVAVAQEIEKERADLERYVNLFGYNPKFGPPSMRIGSITYKPQPYDFKDPLYL